MNEVTISRSEYSRLKEECRLCSASHDEQQLDIKELADNLLCAGEVIKRTNPELGKAYKTLANKHLKKGE